MLKKEKSTLNTATLLMCFTSLAIFCLMRDSSINLKGWEEDVKKKSQSKQTLTDWSSWHL